ncbi:MAG TPA: hypothetical protein VF422_06670 [Dokdonella sp.]
MSWSRITGAKAGSADGDTVTTSGINTAGADLLVAIVAQESAVADAAFSDSKGNTWTKLTGQTESPGKSVLYWCRPTSVGSGHTFTATQSSSRPSVCVEAWSGSATSPFDQQNGAHSSDGGATLATGSVTPTQDNELVIAGAAARGQTVSSIDGGFTLANSQAGSATNDGAAIAYLVQTSATAANPTWTFGTAGSIKMALIATFKQAPVTSNGNMFLVW